jgi:hypothetical protein
VEESQGICSPLEPAHDLLGSEIELAAAQNGDWRTYKQGKNWRKRCRLSAMQKGGSRSYTSGRITNLLQVLSPLYLIGTLREAPNTL